MKKAFLYNILLLLAAQLFFSCEEIVLEEDITTKEQFLVAPANDAQFFSTGITFTWEPVEGAKQYRLQIAKPTFENPDQIVLDTIITATSFTSQLNIGGYEWRVKAINGNYSTAYKKRAFTVVNNDDFENNTVVLVSPSNNLITNVAVQNLSWQPIIGATSYQVQVYDATNTVISNLNTATSTLPYTFPQGNYQWRVRASNGTNQTLYASRSLLVDTTNPNTPVLNAPTNGGTTATNDVTFQWTRTPIAGSAETDKISIYKDSALTILHLSVNATSPFTVDDLPAGTYYWFVKASDAAGNSGNQSTTFSFNRKLRSYEKKNIHFIDRCLIDMGRCDV